MMKSPAAQCRTVFLESIYRWIYALPKSALAKSGILLQSKRAKRQSVKPLGERTGRKIIGMVSIDARPEQVADRRVSGAWEGDLVRHEALLYRAEVEDLRRCAVVAA